ncbi:MAG TPA: CBS domain-containing protein [Thermomicrobiales bacterium]|nr:CBS domain-containing protein [Thermomicrobiales bacterium]
MTDETQTGVDPEPIVREIMQTNVPTVAPEDTVPVVATMMVQSGINGVPVIENGRMIGIITDSDIIAREADVDAPMPVVFLDAYFTADAGRSFEEEARRALAINARQLMSSPVVSIRETATLSHIATLMIDEGVNPVPVLDASDNLVGIVSRADLVRVIACLESEGTTDDTTA